MPRAVCAITERCGKAGPEESSQRALMSKESVATLKPFTLDRLVWFLLFGASEAWPGKQSSC